MLTNSRAVRTVGTFCTASVIVFFYLIVERLCVSKYFLWDAYYRFSHRFNVSVSEVIHQQSRLIAALAIYWNMHWIIRYVCTT